jgi:hypothetical protein
MKVGVEAGECDQIGIADHIHPRTAANLKHGVFDEIESYRHVCFPLCGDYLAVNGE